MSHPRTPLAVVRACMQAYVDKDRASLEALLDGDYRFTSPIDNGLDHDTYIKVCWPNSAQTAGFDYTYEMEDGVHAFVVYELQTAKGNGFRNCEVHTVRNGKLVATEVYFGWEVPHKVPRGQHADSAGQESNA